MTENGKKPLRHLIIAIMAFVVLIGASYFVYQTFLDKPNIGLFSTKITPLNVLPKLGSNTATMAVNAKGGELKLADETTITFPAKSVMDSQVVTATKLESIGNLPDGYELVSGIELSPATQLGAAAKIRLPLPAGTDTKKLVGFEYTDDGKDFFLTPFKIVGQTAELTINGFSGHGVISVGDSSQLPPNPSTVERQTKQSIGDILRGNEELTVEDLSKIKNLLTAWFDASVRPRLEKAAGADDASVDSAVHEFVDWLSITQLYGLDDQLMDQKNSGDSLSAEALKSASDKAYTNCVDNKDPSAAARLLRWYMLTDLMGLDGTGGLSAQTIEDHAKQCVNFELKITSEFKGSDGEKSTAVGSVTLSIDEDLTISGEGKIEQIAYYRTASKPCKASAPLIFPVKVPGIIFDTNANPEVSVYFELGEPENGRSFIDCSTDNFGFTFHGLQPWREDFSLAHDRETISDLGYLIKDFEVLGSGGIYAKKSYIGSTGGQSEQTTFELLHQPK